MSEIQWLEIIEIRGSLKNRSACENKILYLINQINSEEDSYKITFYKNELIETDISIHLSHSMSLDSSIKSPLAERIESALKEFGLINYSLWKLEKHN